MTPLLLSAAAPGALELGIDGQRSPRGVVQLCLTRDPVSFPGCSGDTSAVKRSVPAGERTVRIEGLATGSYAVALFHDENGNGRLDTRLGIPREGFGFSRNPPVYFGPPSFAAARFPVASGATGQQVRLKYLF